MFIDSDYHLWDAVGVDSKQFVRTLFGDAVTKIAPFQSLETEFNCACCSILRLCEDNFRLGLHGDSDAWEQIITATRSKYQRVWVKQCEQMKAIALPESVGLNSLPRIASTKLPHRLAGLGLNCAVPARIDGISVLIWRHPLRGKPAFELHTAVRDNDAIRAKVET